MTTPESNCIACACRPIKVYRVNSIVLVLLTICTFLLTVAFALTPIYEQTQYVQGLFLVGLQVMTVLLVSLWIVTRYAHHFFTSKRLFISSDAENLHIHTHEHHFIRSLQLEFPELPPAQYKCATSGDFTHADRSDSYLIEVKLGFWVETLFYGDMRPNWSVTLRGHNLVITDINNEAFIIVPFTKWCNRPGVLSLQRLELSEHLSYLEKVFRNMHKCSTMRELLMLNETNDEENDSTIAMQSTSPTAS